MTVVRKRPAIDGDRPFLEALLVAAVGPYAAQLGWSAEEIRRRFREEIDPAKYQVVVVDGTDAGCIVVEDHGESMFIDYVALLPSHQRQGIGTSLVREVLAQAAASGVAVRLNVLRINPARSLYERLGFRIVGGDEHRHYMEWTEGDEPVAMPIEDTLDLHTFAPRDAKALVEDYLTLAAEKGFPEVRIIHGKGTGTLRRIVHGVLARHPAVASFRLAGDAGGWGATVVALRRAP